MRKIGVIVLLFILFSGTAFADSNWPPEIQTDIPVITFDAADFSGLTDTFQQSLLISVVIDNKLRIKRQIFNLSMQNTQTNAVKGANPHIANRKTS